VEQSVVPKSEDGTTDGTIFEKWGKVSLEAGDAFGKTLRIVDESRQGMIDAGFQDVTEHRFKVAIGGWARDPKLKEMGRFNRLQWEVGMEGWTMMLLTKVLGVSFTFAFRPGKRRKRNLIIHGNPDFGNSGPLTKYMSISTR
jgi:hypothetical protein